MVVVVEDEDVINQTVVLDVVEQQHPSCHRCWSMRFDVVFPDVPVELLP